MCQIKWKFNAQHEKWTNVKQKRLVCKYVLTEKLFKQERIYSVWNGNFNNSRILLINPRGNFKFYVSSLENMLIKIFQRHSLAYVCPLYYRLSVVDLC